MEPDGSAARDRATRFVTRRGAARGQWWERRPAASSLVVCRRQRPVGLKTHAGWRGAGRFSGQVVPGSTSICRGSGWSATSQALQRGRPRRRRRARGLRLRFYSSRPGTPDEIVSSTGTLGVRVAAAGPYFVSQGSIRTRRREVVEDLLATTASSFEHGSHVAQCKRIRWGCLSLYAPSIGRREGGRERAARCPEESSRLPRGRRTGGALVRLWRSDIRAVMDTKAGTAGRLNARAARRRDVHGEQARRVG